MCGEVGHVLVVCMLLDGIPRPAACQLYALWISGRTEDRA